MIDNYIENKFYMFFKIFILYSWLQICMEAYNV